ncbi:MAG TPA: ParB N-terminal domain-containing protein [Sphingobium sp.]|uniref:ParB/RepB/Spo0J family partition protein n=1 Tax=Sphingobium sp. TaxID=1912891 RepID=UPI002ED168D1
MKLEFIPLDKLSVAKANMRHGKKPPDVTDILPTIRARGVLQSLVVRPIADGAVPGGFEIIAGRRRHHAASIVAEERRAEGVAEVTEPVLLPCAIIDEGDDAAAVEASLIENFARLDPDEVTQWDGFVRLIREGRSPADIAATFGLPDLAVRRILALGNLLPRIRDLYRRAEIDAATVRHLTLASKAQQRSWLALFDDPDSYVPTGHQLKSWLFGGQSIAVKHALFDLDAYGGAIIADLFGEDRYFGDGDAFWGAQNAAIEARREAYLDEGWPDVVIVGPHETFHSWEHARAPKRKGGRIYINVRANGEVTFHEGFVTSKEAQRIAKGEKIGEGHKPPRPEISSTLRTYIDLHRHAAVRTALLTAPGLALRLLAAHTITGSHLWNVKPDPRTSRNEAIADSVETSRGETVFDEHRRAVLATLGLSPEEPELVGADVDFPVLFARLIDLPDPVIMEIVAMVMGETLASGSVPVEAVGLHLGLDMADWWQADDAFFELLRDRQILGELVSEVASPMVADANKGEKTKVLKRIVRDHLEGSDGRKVHARWVPRWMCFPPAAYTDRGGVATVEAHAAALRRETEAGPSDPQPPAAPGAALNPGDDRLAA